MKSTFLRAMTLLVALAMVLCCFSSCSTKGNNEEAVLDENVSGTNTVTVLNNVDSTISVNAEFSYEENDAYVNDPKYENLDHFFTSGSSKTSPMVNTPQVVAVGEKKTVYFWLKGTLDRSVTTDFVSGDCIVTISGGG